VDRPGARYWRELAATFAEAKVILSVRDPDDWFDSVQATIHPFIEARGTHSTAHLNAIAGMAYKAIVRPIFDDRLSDRNHAIRVFEKHIEDVRSIPAERLLVFDVGRAGNPFARSST
jgi:Sulfotransferase domain